MIIIALIIIILVLVYEVCKLKRLVKQEGFVAENTEALANLSSMYKDGTLIVTNLEVIGN